jgi:hypothetical protein
MSMATRTDTQSPALHVADSHDLIRVQGARGAHRYSPKCPEGRCSRKLVSVILHSPGPTEPKTPHGPGLLIPL